MTPVDLTDEGLEEIVANIFCNEDSFEDPDELIKETEQALRTVRDAARDGALEEAIQIIDDEPDLRMDELVSLKRKIRSLKKGESD